MSAQPVTRLGFPVDLRYAVSIRTPHVVAADARFRCDIRGQRLPN